MALKNTKIVREITQTCNKYLSSKPDLPSSNIAQELSENIQENLHEFRYDVSNTTRSPIIPKVSFSSREPEQIALFEMHHLQPATYPKSIKVNTNPTDEDVWQLHKISDSRKYNIQYPTDITMPQQRSSLVTETFKRNLLKGHVNMVGNRNYSTSPFMFVSRHYSNKGQKKDSKCEKPKKKCPEGPCPRIGISKQCERSGGSHCEHFYIDPKCQKKMAPYPSYSESCHDQLEDDPSECFQCPWNKCGGTESIKPPKRKYHTSVRPYNMAMIPGHFQLLTNKICDARKKPCKAPPPKCGEKKDEKCPGAKKKKKKCDSWTEAYALWSAKENVVPNTPWDTLEIKKEAKKDENDFPYDKRQGDYEYFKEKPCSDDDPKCKKKKFKRTPEGCDPNPYRRCMPDSEKVTLELQKCPTEPPKCPPKDKQRCPEVDLTIDVTMDLAKEHDKGHPPPCPEKKKESENCPKKKKKDPWKDQRDLDEPFFRKNPKPYPPIPDHT